MVDEARFASDRPRIDATHPIKRSEVPMSVAEVADGVLTRLRAHQVRTVDELYAQNGVPHESIVNKHTAYLTPLIEDFINRAPFFFIATADAEGNCDVSPKGDPAGG